MPQPRPRIAWIDVGYSRQAALAAGVIAAAWDAPAPECTCTVRLEPVSPYRPGAFYERELPPILALLDHMGVRPTVAVVDGYVWLDGDGRKGLGAHLHDAAGIPVVGVAKSAFRRSTHAIAVRRGGSARPLYVTAAGIDPDEAADAVRRMHGDHRIPTLARLADRLSRGDGGAARGG